MKQWLLSLSILTLLAACGQQPEVRPADIPAGPADLIPLAEPNVSTIAGLRAALLDPSIDPIILAAGTYLLNDTVEPVTGELEVYRPVTIRAAVGLEPGSVVLDATPGTGGVNTRVAQTPGPASLDISLKLTGANAVSDDAETAQPVLDLQLPTITLRSE